MKKLGKTTISPEKIMKNEELINLHGGYQGWCCYCDGYGIMGGVSNESECRWACADAYTVLGYWSDQC